MKLIRCVSFATSRRPRSRHGPAARRARDSVSLTAAEAFRRSEGVWRLFPAVWG